MKLFYFLTAFVAGGKGVGKGPNLDWIGRLDELERTALECPTRLPSRPFAKLPVGRHITYKLEIIHKAAKKACQFQQQVCQDEYGIWKQEDDKQRKIDEANPCNCIMDTLDGYKKFFNHVKQNGISSKGKDHGNFKKRLAVLNEKLKNKLNAKYQCSIP